MRSPTSDGAGAALTPEQERRLADVVQRLRRRSERAGRYSVGEELGHGGMGSVHRAFEDDLERTLAMKVIRGVAVGRGEANTPSDARRLARFLDEARITAQLDHPGIVPTHDIGIDAQGRAYFTMKLVEGRDLERVLELVRRGEEGWTRTRALSVLLKVCEAVAFAHSRGVIHRDLKPANVMIGAFGEVYVMDWGLARVAGTSDADPRRASGTAPRPIASLRSEDPAPQSDGTTSPFLTMYGDVIGTPSYMAPEQARGELDRLGPHSDVYSLGAMLYQLLAGVMPYVGEERAARNETLERQMASEFFLRMGEVGIDRQVYDFAEASISMGIDVLVEDPDHSPSLLLAQRVRLARFRTVVGRWSEAAALLTEILDGARATARAPSSPSARR